MILPLVLLFLFLTTLHPQGLGENSGYFLRPVKTSLGIVFTDNFGSGVYTIRNGSVHKLLSAPGSGNYFTISPGGESIIAKITEPRGQKLISVSLLTGFQREITEFSETIGQGSFSNQAAFAYTEGNIFILRENDTDRRFRLPAYANLAPISPDGSFAVYNDQNDQLYLLELKSGSSEMITSGEKGYFHPQWSPDGRYILFSSLDAGLYIYSLSEKNVKYIARGFNPSWSSNGTEILFETREEINGVFENSDISIYTLASAQQLRLTATPEISEMTPSLSSDGTLLYAVREEKAVYQARYIPSAGVTSAVRLISAERDYIERSREELSFAPPTESMNIPYVHQVWDSPDWFNGHSACGAGTAIMLIAYWNLLPPYEGWCSWPAPGHYNYYGRYIADRYRFRQVDYQFTANDPNGKPSFGGYGYMWNGSYSPYSRMVSYYSNHGIQSSREDAPTFAKAEAQITAGNPYTICNGLTTAGHIVLAHGVNAVNRTVTVNDPYGNKNTPGYPSYDGKNAVYDWPGYNNGFQNMNTVYWCVNTSYTVPAHGDTIIDDLDFNRGFYLHNRHGANMLHYRDMTQGYKGHFWYTTTRNGMNDTCYATWKPNLASDGMYEVKVYIPFSNATDAVYRVVRNGGITDVLLNQKLYSNQWVSLGVHPFKAGSSGYLRLGDKSSLTGQELVFDAAQWNLIDPVLSAWDEQDSPSLFGITANYPNPFNPSTQISFTLSESGFSRLAIYNILGGLETVLVNGQLESGSHTVEFSAGNMPSGAYFAVLQSGGRVSVHKLTLIK